MSSRRRARRSATRGHLGDLDLLPRGLLDGADLPVLARLGQRDGDAFAPGPADAADPVDVRLGLGRDVEVDHVREVLDIQSPGGHVGGDQEVGGLAPELLHHPRCAAPGSCRREGPRHLVAARAQVLGQLIDLVAAAAEDDRRGRVLHVQHASQRRQLVPAGDDVGGLADQRGGSRDRRPRQRS